MTRRALTIATLGGFWGLASHSHATAQTVEWDAPRTEALKIQLNAHAHVRAFLMTRANEASFTYYRADTSADTRLNVASVTKSVLALLAGIAAERGAIAGLDEPLSEFFPEFTHGTGGVALRRVTLRHLLTMSSGLDHTALTADSDFPDFLQRLFAPGLLSHALGRPLRDEPGTRFYYSNIDAHLLALALSRRLGVTLIAFAREALFAPLGIEGVDWPIGQDGVANGASELRLTAPDLLRIGQMMRDGGRWRDRQVVPTAFVREASSRQIASDLPARGPKALWGYGFLWWTSSTPVDNLPAFYATGYGGQFIYVVPALQLVVATLTEQASREVAHRTALLIRDFALPTVAR